MENESKAEKNILQEMIKGYGPKFPPLEELFRIGLEKDDLEKLMSPFPALGRYRPNVIFLADVTSAKSIGLKRFKVTIEYFIALSKLMAGYRGPRRKIIRALTRLEIAWLRKLGTTLNEIKQAESIESFSEHDTAAAGDYLKLKIAYQRSMLAPYIEVIQFGLTSEDTMSIVFGIIANELVYVHFMGALLDFCDNWLKYVKKYPEIISALTHEQAAEPTLFGKKVANALEAINDRISDMVELTSGCFKPFSGKLSGAVGNFTCHYATYPDINWEKFARSFVESFGLYFEGMANQCVSYTREAQLLNTICVILSEVLKLMNDFVKMVRCPAQFFVKEKKPGMKGSSIMPNKSNLWQIEGAIVMLKKTIELLGFLAKELVNYPEEGNMARSFLMRDIGTDFSYAFIAFKRMTRELNQCVPNPKKISAFLNEYPGIAGSSIQTVLKREGISGDAYRLIQEIAINPDGSYANSEQFKAGLESKMNELGLSENFKGELRSLLDPKILVGHAQEMVNRSFAKLERAFNGHRQRIKMVKTF